ncbi:hypothetical protein LY78DRAFT_471149 [Colletotrichum sublineola]|nr:hypothetical protein LY78DRAFT_471149 [Colletotrichum sublineola]
MCVIVRRQQAGVNPRPNTPVTKFTNIPHRHQYYTRIIPSNADATKGLFQGPCEMSHTHTHAPLAFDTHSTMHPDGNRHAPICRLSGWSCGTRTLPCRCMGGRGRGTCDRTSSLRHSREALCNTTLSCSSMEYPPLTTTTLPPMTAQRDRPPGLQDASRRTDPSRWSPQFSAR